MAKPQDAKDGVDRLLDQWRKEMPDLRLEAMGLAARLGRVAALGERQVVEGLAPFGLKLGEFDVLATIRRAGGAAGVTPTELYRSLMLSSGAVTHRLDKLEEAGLVERRDDPRDKRGYRIALTRKGRELIEKAVVAHVDNEERMLSVLNRAERESLDQVLRKLLASIR